MVHHLKNRMQIEPFIAADALARLKTDRRAEIELRKCEARFRDSYARLSKRERVIHAEPISTAIGLSALIAGFGVTAATAGVIGGAIVGVAFSVGVNVLARALTAKPTDAGASDSNINAPESRLTEKQSIPSKRIIYGSALVGGAIFFEAVKAPYLYIGYLICAKPISAFRKMWIGTSEISLPGFTPGSALVPISSVGQPNYPGRLLVSFRLGATTQAIDPILAADFASLSSEFRQRGIATAVVRFRFGADQAEFTALWGQVSRPNALFLVDGVAVCDPRNPAHRTDWNPSDPIDTAAAEATWSFSNNASLCQAHYLTQPYGGRIIPQRIDWDKVAIAAEYDDGLVGCADGTLIKRHTMDGMITLNQKPFDVMKEMLTANRGFVLESAGRIWVSSSKPRTPIATIHDGILTGAVQYQAARAKRDLVNKVRSRFVASEREYQVSDGPILSRTDLQASDGEILEATLSFPFTLDHRRDQRLTKAFLENSRLGRLVTCSVDIDILEKCDDELIGNAVTFDSRLFPQLNGNYLVTAIGFAPTFASMELALVEYDSSIESNWIAATDEQPFTLAALNVT